MRDAEYIHDKLFKVPVSERRIEGRAERWHGTALERMEIIQNPTFNYDMSSRIPGFLV